MEANIDSDPVEQDLGLCACQGRPSLDVLKDVQKAYEERIDLIKKTGGKNKMQKEMELMRSWVGDLLEQNGLLAHAIEEMEAEVSSRMVFERRRNLEIESELRAEVLALRRCLARKDSDVRGLLELLRRLRDGDRHDIHGIRFYEVTEHDIFGINGKPDLKCEDKQSDRQSDKQIHKRKSKKEFENLTLDHKKGTCDKVNELKVLNDSLKKENVAKDREIRKLSEDVKLFERTIDSMRHESSFNRSIPVKEEGVMTEASSPINECAVVLAHETSEGIGHHHEVKQKSSDENIRAIRKENVDLREEVRAMSQLCAALYEQRLAASLRLQFKDDIIREMRRQLRLAKAKLEVTKSLGGEHEEGEGTRRSRRPRRSGPGIDWTTRNQDQSPDGSISIHFD